MNAVPTLLIMFGSVLSMTTGLTFVEVRRLRKRWKVEVERGHQRSAWPDTAGAAEVLMQQGQGSKSRSEGAA
jgi:hypothetical protein